MAHDRRLARRLFAGLLSLGGLAVVTADPGAPDVAAPEVVRAIAAYVQNYEDQLTLVLADEQYDQQIIYQRGLPPGAVSSRHIKSEVFFTFLPATHEWMAIRDIASVDGRDVANRPDVRQLLDTMPVAVVERSMKALNSRYNLGGVSRNYNEPTLSLLVFDRLWIAGFAFDLKRTEGRGEASLATLAFREQTDRTLITDLDGRPVRSSGEVTAEVATGRIHRITLRTDFASASSNLTTSYTPDAKLLLWVPATFSEAYQGTGDLSWVPAQNVVCDARYSNYRRFEVHGGIKGGDVGFEASVRH